MNNATRPSGPLDRNWWTIPRIACVSLLLLASAYVYSQPTLERWLGRELPTLANDGEKSVVDQADGPVSAVNDPASGWVLEQIGRDTWRSPAGLVWGSGSGTDRIEHVMRHARDDGSRKVHGVFDADSRDEVLMLVDDAYRLVSMRPDLVDVQHEGNRDEYTITMERQIGFVGGENGKQRNNPRTSRLKLILERDRVITAYPTWP